MSQPNEPPKQPPSRRDLIRPPFTSTALGSTAGNGLPPDAAASEIVNDGPLLYFSSNAMGCQFQVLCEQDALQPIAESVDAGFALIQNLESRLTIFSDSSEMAFINRLAGEQPVAVEPGLFQLLSIAQEISVVSGGAFDLTATPLSHLWKQHRRERSLPSQQSIEEALLKVGYQNVVMDHATKTIEFDHQPLSLDLGGIGKGYALDQLAHQLALSDCCNFLIHGGQSSVIANGVRSDSTENPWQIGITHPLSPSVRLATIDLHGRAIGTSGCGRKSFVVSGRRFGHIIDPRTGWPSDELLSVTVLADSAMMADALATTLFVAGPEQAESLCERFDASAILISEPKGKQNLQIDSIGMSEDEWRLV